MLAQSATAQVCFEADPPINVGLFAVSLLTADLDGDGDTDLVVAGQAAPRVSVLLNDGNNSFAPYVHYNAGVYGVAMTGADLDADGDTDLAVVSSVGGVGTVSVLLNQGNGDFPFHVHYGVGSRPYGITSADFDGDGDIDLATSNDDSNTVSVLLNQGQGIFAPHVQYAASYSPFSVTSADLDGDGDVDLAVANYSAGSVSALLNYGDGTFAAPVPHSVGTNVWYLYHLTNADLNGDGRADLVAAASGNDYVAVLLNQGGGAFAPHMKYAVADGPQQVVTTDLDQDGDLDLAVACAGASSLSLLLNEGDGTFAPFQEIGSGFALHRLTHGDFDGDGDSELVVPTPAAPRVRVFRNCLERGGFCFGDGSLLTNCPCASPDTVPAPPAATAHGCANSLHPAGARLVGVGAVAPAPGTLAFRAHIAPGYADFAFLVKGGANATSGIAAGDGIRCVDGALVRFGAHLAGTNGDQLGIWTYPNSAQTTPVSIATAQAAGGIAYYQLLYRDAAANFCNPATVNWSNGYRVTWPP